MALVVKDRVKETTTTTGTGTINLAGAVSGFQTFVAGVGSTNTTYYAIEDANGTAWEVGLGTVTDASPDTLARTTILANSNGDTSAITLSSGTHTVFATYPAGKAVYLDASGNLSHTVDISSDTNLTAGTGITLTGDTLSTTDSEIVHDNLSGFVANEHIDWTTDQGSTNIHSGNYDSGASVLNDLTDVTIVGTDNLFIEVDGAAPSNSITSGESNIGIGRNALSNVSSGHFNIGIGQNALLAQGAGHSRSIAIGNDAMRYAAANYCVAIGHEALQGDSSSNSSSQYNTAIGYLTLKDATTGDSNVALGYAAGTDLTSGSNNIFIGANAGYVHTTGSNTLYIAYTTEASDGTIIKADMAEKHLAIGMADDLFSNSAGDPTLQIYPKDAADEAIFVKMPTSHSSNLIQIQDSSGTDLFVVDSTGEITTGSISGGGGSGDMTGVDLTGGVGISIDSETNTTSGAYSSTITCNLEGTELASTGETGTSKFLRVDGDGTCSWQVPPDTDTTYTKASFDLDHLFVLVGASADTDENLGTFTGSTISDSRTIKQALQDLETELETKTTNTGDITGVDLTGGTGISIDSETNTASGSYSSTITCNLEGTELASTGETGTSKFLRVDGDGTCSWQVPPDTDTNTQLSTEEVQDIAGPLVATGGTKTLITVTYDDDNGNMDFVVDNDLSNYDNSSSGFLTAHPNISAASSSDNSGRTYIQDITVDSNGHVTGIATATETVTDTNTTYTKADFDLDHLFTLVGASADSDEHLGTFTGSTISDNQTIKAAIQALETAVETKGAGDITGVDLTGGTGISIDSETNTGSGAYSSTITCNLEGTELASTGETGTAKFLRVDGDGTCSWQVPPDTDTTYTKASFDLDHLFALAGASADTDENLGTFTGSTISDSRTIKQALQDLETELETKGVGDMTGVDLTGGTGISIESETNTGSGAYSSTITCNLEGTELASTGETGTSKFLRVDGDGTCSWQVPPDTDTTYTKASFDVDHLFTLVGASADTDEHLSTFTGSTISDNQTIKQALQALETAVETKGTGTVDVSGTPTAGHVAVWTDADTLQMDENQLFWDTSSNELGIGTATPGSTLHVSGSVQFKTYTVGDTGDADWSSNIHELHDATKGANHYILCDTGNTNRTVELPDASSALAGRTYVIKKIDSGTGTVTIQPDDNDGTDGYLDRDNATVDDGTNILWAQFDTISCTCAEGYTDGQYEWHIVHEKVAPHTARIDLAGALNVSTGTDTQVTFDTLKWAVGAGTTITGGTRKVTINRKGKYSISFQVAFSNTFDLGEKAFIKLYKNGSVVQWSSTEFSPSTNNYIYGWLNTTLSLDVDDYIQIYLEQSSGETATIYNSAEDSSSNTYWEPFLIVSEVSK